MQLLTVATSSNSVSSPLVVGMPSEGSGRRGQNGVIKQHGQTCSRMVTDLLAIRMNGSDGIPKQRSKNGSMQERSYVHTETDSIFAGRSKCWPGGNRSINVMGRNVDLT